MDDGRFARGGKVPVRQASRIGIGAAAPAIVALVLALSLLLGTLPFSTLPAVKLASASTTEFSAERAARHLAAISREPRPIASAGHAATREYLIAELRALGLEPEIQTTTAINRFPGAESFDLAAVQNVVARLPGTSSTGAIVLNAHYDGAATGPGASDCGACVAAAVETARALRSSAPLRNDVILVFSDAEENRDVGAAALVAEHPLAKEVRLAINFEAMARGGPSIAYYFSPDNAWLVGEYARVAPLPFAHSFFSAFVRLFPDQQFGCDLDEYLNAGAQGIGFIHFTDDTTVYHTARDTAESLDPRTLQHHGENALAVVRHFGALDLAASRSGDAVFFNVLPGVLAHYPADLSLPLAALSAAVLLAQLVVGLRRRRLTPGGLAAGTIAFPLVVFLAVVLTTLAWAGIKSANADLQVFLIGGYASDVYLVGLGALTVALVAGAYALLLGRARVASLSAGALIALAALSLALASSAPTMSYALTLPLLGGLVGLGWLVAGPGDPKTVAVSETATVSTRGVLVVALAAAPGVVITVPLVGMLAPLFSRLDAMAGLPLLGVPLALPALLLGTLLPHLALLGGVVSADDRPKLLRRLLVPGLALLAAVALIGLAGLRSGFDAAHPRPTSIAYLLDADRGEASWLSADHDRGGWLAPFGAGGWSATPVEALPAIGLPAYAAPAKPVALAAPEAVLLGESVEGGARQLRLRIVSPRRAPMLTVAVDSPTPLLGASVAGKPLDPDSFAEGERRQLALSYAGLPTEGFELTLVTRGAGPVRLTLVDSSPGLPADAGVRIEPRPTGVVPMPGSTLLDPTAVRRMVTIGE